MTEWAESIEILIKCQLRPSSARERLVPVPTHGYKSGSRYLSRNSRFARYDWISAIVLGENLVANHLANKPMSDIINT